MIEDFNFTEADLYKVLPLLILGIMFLVYVSFSLWSVEKKDKKSDKR